jgi:hypothetical protein
MKGSCLGRLALKFGMFFGRRSRLLRNCIAVARDQEGYLSTSSFEERQDGKATKDCDYCREMSRKRRRLQLQLRHPFLDYKL